jgi:hypothetical protein
VGTTTDERKTARELHRVGNGLFEKAEFRDALDVYLLALESWDHPAIRYNAAECMAELGDHAGAYRNISAAVAFGPEPLGDATYRRAVAHHAELESAIARIEVRCPQTDVTITVDGAMRWSCDAGTPLVVSPGEHRVVAVKPNHLPATHFVSATAGRVAVVHVGELEDDSPSLLDAQPRSDIDRSATLPRGLNALKMRLGGTVPRGSRISTLVQPPVPLYWDWSPSSRVTIEYMFIIPHRVTVSLVDTYQSSVSATAAFDFLGFADDLSLSGRAEAELRYRHRVTDSVAMTSAFGAYAHFFDQIERTAVGPSVGTLFQLTDTISASGTVRVDHGSNDAVMDEPQDEGKLLAMTLELGIAWNAARNWRFELSYVQEAIGYPIPSDSGELKVVRYW